ncbi:protein arginine N-methyltransferase 3-like [Pollicipes pollicipes]|uniref:protein arginine N-methyltransferase 3-like n=1 Tax=Pollicipes pollicipes TaxID=41117 RepID=UPI001885A2DE|nr:protein arginine N-methyltransferase 3-like [Pollicipes pollicipes]
MDVLTHCQQQHDLDLAALVTRHALDCFGYIRLVNFVRSMAVSPGELRRLPGASWADHKYMKPVIECDPLLMIDLEDLVGAPAAAPPPADDASRHVVNYEGDYVTLSLQASQDRDELLLQGDEIRQAPGRDEHRHES